MYFDALAFAVRARVSLALYSVLVGCTTDREFTCTALHAAQVSPCPEGLNCCLYYISYLSLYLFDALYRANGHALRLIEVPFALYACIRVDHIDDITFSDGLRRAFRQTGAAGNAVVIDLHSHRVYSPL
jgi:hypothetical protein